MYTPSAAALIIGDEILSGRTQDVNMHHLAKRLSEHRITLKEARFIKDEAQTIASSINHLRTKHDYVFTSGGIGPTHDDITADAIALAFEVQINHHPQAMKILEHYYAERKIDFNSSRQRMARIPVGATLIENPITKAPGFLIGNVYVMAGVPKVFAAMLENILPSLNQGPVFFSTSLRLTQPEGDIAVKIREISQTHPELSIGSYPFFQDNIIGTNIVIKGTNKVQFESAIKQVKALISYP